MTNTTSISRRTVIGAFAANALVPCFAGAQSRQSGTLGKEGGKMKIEVSFDKHVFTATLFDNPSARDLLSMLPFDGKIEDYSTNEKIIYLPRKLTEKESRPFGDEAIGDLCYYAPWGNLVLYYAGYRYAPGLIRLGRLDDGIEPLLTRGEFPASVRLAG